MKATNATRITIHTLLAKLARKPDEGAERANLGGQIHKDEHTPLSPFPSYAKVVQNHGLFSV